MRRRSAIAALIFALVALAQQAALAASGDPQKRLSRADTRLATNVLLKRGDLGAAGWKRARSSAASGSACGIVHRMQPNETDLVETGAATGPLFTNNGIRALTQTARVFVSRRQATTAWARTDTKNLIICMEQQVENTSSMGAPVSVTDWRPLRLPRLVDHLAGFRVVATAKTSAKTTSKVYFDLILLGHSRTITKLVLSSLQKPFATGYEARLTRIVAHRLNHQ